MDRLTREQRSRNMASIGARDTLPELRVRSSLHRAGFRFRLHRKSLPGRPDIVLSKYKAVVFVHGCFWHRHAGCRNATMPSSNRAFWLTKLTANKMRDRRNARALRAMGWRVYVVWECETKRDDRLGKCIRRVSRRIRELLPVARGRE